MAASARPASRFNSCTSAELSSPHLFLEKLLKIVVWRKGLTNHTHSLRESPPTHNTAACRQQPAEQGKAELPPEMCVSPFAHSAAPMRSIIRFDQSMSATLEVQDKTHTVAAGCASFAMFYFGIVFVVTLLHPISLFR